MQLGCMLCHKVRKTEKGMLSHLVKEHQDTVSCHLNIVDNFSCEEGSAYWKKFIVPTLTQLNNDNKTKKEEP